LAEHTFSLAQSSHVAVVIVVLVFFSVLYYPTFVCSLQFRTVHIVTAGFGGMGLWHHSKALD